MGMRHIYAWGILLTFGCGSKVEIGHGVGGAGAANGSMAGSQNSGGDSASPGGESSGGSAPGNVAGSSGTDTGGGTGAVGGASDYVGGASDYVGGPIPSDNGPQAETGKVDLLLAIDNSRSMTEKQQLFAEALPQLVERLVNPRCVSSAGSVVATPASPDAACPSGSQREFAPLRDLHIGAITSSLGSHGAQSMSGSICAGDGEDDHAHLLPLVREEVESYDGRGYLKWDPDELADPPGESDSQALANAVREMVMSAGESGCGYEAQLESVYRFLVDPEPYQSVEVSNRQITSKVGIDEELLRQRADFLRPDSSVVVLMLTDENDCSIVDDSYGWLISRPHRGTFSPMFRSTSSCQSSANDPCCQSCGESSPRAGCPAFENDSECQKGRTLPVEEDDINLRCWEQKRRFGFDLLYPTARYVGGFGGGTVPARDGTLVPNPLFHAGGKTRDPSLFTFAVVGGLPWQDTATAASLSGGSLQLLTAAQLETQGRWPLLVGDADQDVPPADPFMRESIVPRSGKHPLTGDSMVPESSLDPEANAINGHEHDTFGSELEYACTFPLSEPIVCDEARSADSIGCDCDAAELDGNRSVCNPPGGGAATITQYRGKAYPSLRELSVARGLGRRTVVGSVCSVNTADDGREDYGYRPIFNAVGQRIAATLEKP